MNVRILTSMCLIAAIVGVVWAGSGEDVEKLKAAPDPAYKLVTYERHAASLDIWGTWIFDDEITAKTSPDTQGKYHKDVEWTFEKNKDSTARLKEQFPKLLAIAKEKKPGNYPGFKRGLEEIYATGRLIIKSPKRPSEADFALIIYFGEPYVLFLRKKKNGEYDWESCYYRFIYDSESENDFLMLGGDFFNEPFRAYKRKPEAEDE